MTENPTTKKDDGRKDVLSGLRHDIRTCVGHIIGYSELLLEEAKDLKPEEIVPDLQKIKGSGQRLLELVELAFGGPGQRARAGGRTAAQEAGSGGPAGPRWSPSAAPSAGQSAPAEAGVLEGAVCRQGGPGRILVADDSEMNRDMLARRLESAGYAVDTAADGRQALDMIAKGEYDLVLLDVMMPELNGLEVLKAVRENKSIAELPVVMATAKGASKDVVEALRLGANDYVTKPLDFPVVLARTRSQLALKFATEEVRRLAAGLEVRNEFIRRTFGRYLSDEVVSRILESPEGLELGGETRQVTILMSDLRGFTSMSERLKPEEVVRMLNDYLGAMTEIILEHEGTIDEFVGDAILAIFGAPISREDDARRALACALSMQAALEKISLRLRDEGLPALDMGIAVHTGPAVVGNIGSQRRAKYGVVGPPVNMTGRIESHTVGGQILVSEQTVRRAGDDVELGRRFDLRVKGALEPMAVHELLGLGGGRGVRLPERGRGLVPVPKEVSVRFTLLEGKEVGASAMTGILVRLSTTDAEIRSQARPEPLSDFKLAFSADEGRTVVENVYAKVTDALEGGLFRVRFTSMSPVAGVWIRDVLPGAASDR
ncbi:MAG: adenylate/guanylate cyclase domain-containing protein [Elusimicrobiota bacterium]